MTILETIIYVLLYLLIGAFTLLLVSLISNLIKYFVYKHKINNVYKGKYNKPIDYKSLTIDDFIKSDKKNK